MTIKPELKAEPREATGKGYARRLRAGGRIPAVVYGHKMETMSITVDAKEAEQLFHDISVENTIVELKIAGKKTPLRTLVREIQTHPLRPDFVHIDFYRIQKGVAVEVEIPISLQGTPEGVRQEGGILDQIVYEIRVKCIPSKIPESVDVDVTRLEIGDA
ncbi:MAG: 50S ribosomal protein L25, partial [Gemmatimonadetes bacterium]|nr:50S ribosomal protein L25 [Gemmatimonadota bacterium]